MARYDYRCSQCGVFEISHSMKDPAVESCPTCSSKIERLISSDAGSAVHYKGSGFFKTDYRKVDSNIKKYMPVDPTEKKQF